MDNISCPFCNETGFDKPGLAYHLLVYCDEHTKAISAYYEERMDFTEQYRRKMAMENTRMAANNPIEPDSAKAEPKGKTEE